MKKLFFALILSAMCGTAFAATYYVSPTGDDVKGKGTKEAPFATIGRADELMLLAPGDTVSVGAGAYDSVRHTFASGTADAPIVYRGESGARVKSSVDFGTADIPVSYITLEGLEFECTVNFRGSSERNSVKNCLFDIPAGKACAAFHFGDQCVFEGNKVLVKEGDTTALVEICDYRRCTPKDNKIEGGEVQEVRYAADAIRFGHFPNTKKHRVLQCDFHMHTSDGSDGKVDVAYRVAEAKAMNLDVIAITDHGDNVATRGYAEGQRRKIAKLAEENDMIILPGFETGLGKDNLRWREHILTFDSDADPVEYDHNLKEDGGDHDYMKRLKQVYDEGSFIIWPHPDSDTVEFEEVTLVDELAREPMKKLIDAGIMKGIEVANGETAYLPGRFWGDVYEQDMGPRGAWLWNRCVDYALKKGLTIFANTDTHYLREPCCTLVLADERSRESVREALEAGRTAAFFEDMLWGRFDVIEELMDTMVSVSRHCPNPGTHRDKVAFTNNTPMLLMPEIDGHVYVIRPHETMRLYITIGQPVAVKWTNVFVSSKKPYEKMYP